MDSNELGRQSSIDKTEEFRDNLSKIMRKKADTAWPGLLFS